MSNPLKTKFHATILVTILSLSRFSRRSHWRRIPTMSYASDIKNTERSCS